MKTRPQKHQLLTIAHRFHIHPDRLPNGLEPCSVAYTRNLNRCIWTKPSTSLTPIVREYMEVNHIDEEEDLPDYFVTTSNLNYKDRIDVQAAWQQHIDASISSTVNVPNEFTIGEVEDLYTYAWKKGLKGITIYRDGCERSGILITDKQKKEDRLTKIDRLQEIKVLKKSWKKIRMSARCGGEMMHPAAAKNARYAAYVRYK